VMLANSLAYVHAEDKTTGWIASNTSYAIAVASFIMCVRFNWFNNPPMKWLGGISYSMYLFHPIFMKCGHLFYDAPNTVSLALGTLSILLVGTIGTSIMCERFIERPSVKAGKAVRRLIG